MTDLSALTEPELYALRWDFRWWALPHQRPPAGPWRTWVILGGRGAGKTRAGAEWVRRMVEGPRRGAPGRARRVALLGETIDQAREVMVMGDSGLLACAPPDRRPEWHATRRLLEWPNGATAQLFSAHDPESLRGPQFDAAWADELAKWPKASEAWDMLQMGLRLGQDPRCVVTTTPRTVPALTDLLARPGTVATRAPTRANAANLAPGFLAEMEARYGGTTLGRQEIEGEVVEDRDGTLWPRALIEAARIDAAPALDRIVVAVDPAVTAGQGSDATGIVVAGATYGDRSAWRGYVLEDATVTGASPDAWGRAVARAAARWGASRVVVEANQGGELVATVLRQVEPNLPVRLVHASLGKGLRAEPVAALYEQRRVHHVRAASLAALEDQMEAMAATGYRGRGSPDRLDALVWALHALLLDPTLGAEPRMRALG